MAIILLQETPVYLESGEIPPFWIAFAIVVALLFLGGIAWLLRNLRPRGPWLR